MKDKSKARQTTHQTEPKSDHRASAGPNGVAIAPPTYGLDVAAYQAPKPDPDPTPQLKAEAKSPQDSPQMRAPLQMKQTTEASSHKSKVQPPNNTGLPDNLKSGVETLSGLALDDVKVHYNSSKPTQLQALAYTQGTDIHVGPGQERHLPHEAWHVVQQKQGRVKPGVQKKGKVINNDPHLETEADVKGKQAVSPKREQSHTNISSHSTSSKQVIQGVFNYGKKKNILTENYKDHIQSIFNQREITEDYEAKHKEDIEYDWGSWWLAMHERSPWKRPDRLPTRPQKEASKVFLAKLLETKTSKLATTTRKKSKKTKRPYIKIAPKYTLSKTEAQESSVYTDMDQGRTSDIETAKKAGVTAFVVDGMGPCLGLLVVGNTAIFIAHISANGLRGSQLVTYTEKIAKYAEAHVGPPKHVYAASSLIDPVTGKLLGGEVEGTAAMYKGVSSVFAKITKVHSGDLGWSITSEGSLITNTQADEQGGEKEDGQALLLNLPLLFGKKDTDLETA